MNPKIPLVIIALCAILGWIGFWISINYLSPFGAESYPQIVAFYFSTGIALAGTLTWINYFLRLGNGASLLVLMRQGIILALVILGFLFLQHLQALTWWDGLLLVAIALLFEFLFSSQDYRPRPSDLPQPGKIG
ncbi:MAG: hypothetical protein NTZ80_00085 [Patescibacteria group bacterium]|nr:hypothetical protein [Patescibacteria group bacterium]